MSSPVRYIGLGVVHSHLGQNPHPFLVVVLDSPLELAVNGLGFFLVSGSQVSSYGRFRSFHVLGQAMVLLMELRQYSCDNLTLATGH